MTCREWEEAIALLVDGERAVAGLVEHLEGCSDCRQLLQDLRADQEMLQRAPEIGSAVCDTLRDAALRRMARRRIGWGRWAAAASVAAALLVAGIWLRPGVPPGEPIAVKPQAPAPGAIEKPATAQAHTAPKARRRVRTAKAPGAAPRDADWERAVAEWFPMETKRERRGSQSEVAMQIQTSDPDVVILWLKEERVQ